MLEKFRKKKIESYSTKTVMTSRPAWRGTILSLVTKQNDGSDKLSEVEVRNMRMRHSENAVIKQMVIVHRHGMQETAK